MTSEAVWLRGTVREWSTERGIGVIDAEETSGGCWVHSSMIHMAPPRQLVIGQGVDFTAEQVTDQDGYRRRAVAVVPDGEALDEHRVTGRSGAYRSTLAIRFDGSDSGT